MSIAGRCMARSTSSGTVVGPGIARNSRPARTTMSVRPLLPMARPCWHAAARRQSRLDRGTPARRRSVPKMRPQRGTNKAENNLTLKLSPPDIAGLARAPAAGLSVSREIGMNARLFAAVTAIGLLGASMQAQAQIKFGAILSISGPAAAMGVGYKGAFDFLPSEIAGQTIEYIVRDDATDANTGFTIAQKMISEDHVDAFIGPSLTATDAAVAPLANQAKVPMIAMAPYEYDPQKQPYTFNDAQPLTLMVAKVFKYMQAHGVKQIG